MYKIVLALSLSLKETLTVQETPNVEAKIFCQAWSIKI